ncbi:MAG: phosphatase, partial [Roseococcus sp.]
LYAAPRAADLGGVAVSPDGGTLFAGVRRPGAEQGASFERPATRWPEFTPGQPPRSAIVSLVRG